jgi:uncharacterized protein
MREEQAVHRYDRTAVLAAIEKIQGFWSLFGGEPLILNIRDIEELLALGFKKNNQTGLQTNGNLITEDHINLFIKYKTSVGISLDGPEHLNDIRWAGNLEATRKHTERSMWAIHRLCDIARTSTPHVRPSIIVTLHAGNLAEDRFPRFLQWLHELDDAGIQHLNLHLMEMDYKAHEWYIASDVVAARMIDIWNETFTNLRISNFTEITKLLQGNDEVVCVWHPCDPWNTAAVHGVENDGAPSHCSRTNKDGINWLPAEGSGSSGQDTSFIGHPGTRMHERQLALYVTPQELGGCKDCEYWLLCHGQCPGTGEHNDWRMRTTHCSTIKLLFREGEKRLKSAGVTPITLWPSRKTMEDLAYRAWTEQREIGLGELRRQSEQQAGASGGASACGTCHGDHTDTATMRAQGHGDNHGDRHGDHTDSN